MYRHSPVRNQRSKGIKIKYVLQVCLLVAICFWLIFQVKRSHDKKKEFDMKIPVSTRIQGSEEMVTFGRKDLKPKLEEIAKVGVHEESQEHEQEEEEAEEENKHADEDQEHGEENKNKEEEQDHDEENRHEEEEQEEDKIEEEKDDGGGGGDDEIDENEQEKSEVEIDREEMETIDEDKETEESESEERDEQSQTENGISSDDHDEDGTTVHNHEAREEHYKADDASSAVTHDAQTLGSENENGNGTLGNSIENIVLVDNGETVKNGTSTNNTMIQEKDSGSRVTSMNATTLIGSHENGPPSSTTTHMSDPTQAQNITERVVSGEQAGSSTIATSINYQVAPNATLTKATEEPSNSTNIQEILDPHNSTTEDKGTDPMKTEFKPNAGVGENKTEETVEISDPDALQHGTIDSSDPLHLEEKEVQTDLTTLPEIETEGDNSEDTAAEGR